MSNKCFKVQDFGEVVTGNTPSTSKSEYWDGDYCFFSPFDFTNSPHCNKTDRTITKLGLECGRKIPINSVMVTCIASIGKLAINKKEGVTNQQINTILVNEDFDYNYVYYLLSQNIQKIKNRAAQTAVPIINKTDFCNINLYGEDDIDTQRHIAEILSTTDTLISQTEAIIAKYKSIKQGMLHDLFTRGIDVSTGKLRPTAQQAPHLYKESELGWIPREWEVKRFGDYVNLIHGYQFRDYDFTDIGVPIVKIGQIKLEGLDLNSCSFVDINRVERFKDIIIKNGDVLMALTGATLGKTCYVDNCKSDLLQNYRVGRFEPIFTEKIDKRYLYFMISTNQFLNQVFSKVNAGAQGNIGKSDFEKPLFKLLNLAEQIMIAERLNSVNEKINQEQVILSKYQSIKKGLMKRLLEPEGVEV